MLIDPPPPVCPQPRAMGKNLNMFRESYHLLPILAFVAQGSGGKCLCVSCVGPAALCVGPLCAALVVRFPFLFPTPPPSGIFTATRHGEEPKHVSPVTILCLFMLSWHKHAV